MNKEMIARYQKENKSMKEMLTHMADKDMNEKQEAVQKSNAEKDLHLVRRRLDELKSKTKVKQEQLEAT